MTVQLLRLSSSRLYSVLRSGLVALVVCGQGILAGPALAAEQIEFRVGPLRHTVKIEDLEEFAATGQIPPRLRVFEPLLTDQTREMLNSHVALDPEVSDRILDDVLQSSNGQHLLDTLAAVAPNLSVQELKAAIQLAALQTPGLSLLGILRAIPQDTLQVNGTALIGLISQLNFSRLEGEALGRVLEQELAVSTPLDESLHLVDPTQPGPEEIRVWELRLNDRSRDRRIPIDIYWSRQTQGPLVVMSHGFGADRYFLAYLARHLASHGLTVVSVEHPGSNVAALADIPLDLRAGREPSRILPADEFLERPRDISFVLDRLAQLNDSSFALRDRLNTDQVTLIGHSLGGYTGLALAGAPLDVRSLRRSCADLDPIGLSPAAWLQCAAANLALQPPSLRDERITQVMAMNPLTGDLFSAQGLSQIKVPVLLLAGTQDSVTPIIDQQLRPFHQLTGPKYLVTVVGGTHLSVGDPDNINPELQEIPFMPELRGETTARLRQFLQGLSLSFVMQQGELAEQYTIFLTPEYAQSFSTPELSLRLSQSLPESLTRWLNLNQQAWIKRDRMPGYLVSFLHLEAIDMHRRLQQLQQQMIAYLRTSPPALTVVPLPSLQPQPWLQATTHGSDHLAE
ncbi:Putative aminoacrylate hydrolase RutD [Halomicronema hongdechloris C2206]|uniref:Aminoacrylate hydrolase RutD n=1 Tax=Halomicronema hongdechloris C2206 TaxID=1641165 RepID=A0A1Z3HSP7_9CYAN|nr:alpha/beta hydrolase [Halomicronema hongdechloris]ASC73340.1 Putative aminoacrylate hydrolase RutD [Halomicronema hongdechloris C2206]